MSSRLASVVCVLLALSFGSDLEAQRRGPQRAPRAPDSGEPRAESRAEPREGIQPYDRVIPAEAKSFLGVFRVHEVKKKLFYEIPPEALEKPFLWVTQVAQTQAGFGYGGTAVGRRVVRWQLRDETVLLRDVKFQIRAEVDDPVKHAVEATSLEPIIQAFPVRAWGKDKAPVIDVSDLFFGDVRELSPQRRLNASGIDRSRTFLESVKAFPENLETRVLATYRLGGSASTVDTGPTPTPPAPRRAPRERRDPTQGAVTVLLHHSMVKLPERPMTPRRHDARVGFFSVSFEDYGTGEHQVKTERYITRWRLEKKDPEAAVSEPLKPIVFHVGRGVPAKWRPYVKQGIEMWQPAFEAAGFRRAILARDAPTPREDPDWDAEDARYSTIRWLPATIENAMGPHVHDPRTGEILEADILLYHNVLKLARDWYFVQASPSDERARRLPMPDELLGELLAYIVAHEVGHSLGFPHNMKASSAFTVAQLRDPEFTAKWGTEASIMDYGRFNYVAQPGDGARLIPRIGPYDFFAVEWGYREFRPGAEARGLAAIVARQVDDPMLRFGDADPGEDPARQTEDLGHDPVEATALGLRNLARVADYLVAATCRKGEDYELLRNMYDQLVNQRNREIGHVVSVVGGVHQTNLWYGDAERVYTPVEAERQRAAVAFLVAQVFETPAELTRPDVLDRLEAAGVADRVLAGQRQVLSALLGEARLKRMAELAERDPGAAYPPDEMVAEVTGAIWRELRGEAPVTIGLYRRNLQRAHAEHLGQQLERRGGSSDLPGLARAELDRILAGVRQARPRAADRLTEAHLGDMAERIERFLDPRGASGS
ncbi:MAG: zinc-dependent metalloprotease [Planctomycetes bacterium]|nr:zinc-dependent metalloprotease [Planctomycetota bacterium]